MFKIALAKTSMMCNLATELSETKRKKIKTSKEILVLLVHQEASKGLKKKKRGIQFSLKKSAIRIDC